MEGLIKGLVNVALDAIAGDDQQPPEHVDRSTWAQVVSGGDEEVKGRKESAWNHGKEEEQENDYDRQRRQQNQFSEGKQDDESEGKDGGDWEVVGGRKHHQQQNQQYKEGAEGGDWEVVGGRKQQQHHQQPPRKTPAHKVVTEGWNEYKRPPNEQTYNDDATHGVDTEPTREELNDLSKACNKLWELDLNRLVPGKDYEIDCGRGKKVYQEGDVAQATLFSWLGDDVFKRPTFARFCSLLDNYNPHEGCKEDITPEEKHEQTAFIEAISRTAPIKYLYNYLTSKNIISPNYEDFKRMLSRLWFDLYGRGGTYGCSSAFEHVFVGEIKGRGENEEVSGFHNWVQFYLEEAKGRVDYQGYIFPRRRGESPDSETQLLTVQFEWNGVLKSVSSTLVGVSPEFEVALYTLCYFVGGEDNHVYLGPYAVNIKCYRIGNNKIGSAFPISEC